MPNCSLPQKGAPSVSSGCLRGSSISRSGAAGSPRFAATGPSARYRLHKQEPAIRLSSVKILRTAQGESPEAWREALQSDWLPSAHLLKDDPAASSWVRRATLRGQDVVIKCRALSSTSRRIKHALGMGHAHKQWRGAELLHKAGVSTPQNRAIARARIDGRACELLIADFLEGPTLLECLRDASVGKLPVKLQHAVARAVGRQVSAMGWLFNRDHKPSNLIVTGLASSTPGIAVIDCVGVRRRQVLKTARMFASLVIEPIGCDLLPRRALLVRALQTYQEELEKWFDPNDEVDDRPEEPMTARQRVRFLNRLCWREVDALVRAHPNPRPRINPLQGS